MNFIVKNCKHGKGLFASRKINTGEEILKFRGQTITFEEAVAKGDKMGNPIQIGKNIYIDTEEPEVFINHSCDPNTGLKDATTLVSIKDIQEGEEITFDYSTSMDEDYWEMACSCGTKNCRAVIGDFKHLPNKIKEKYMKLKIVPSWLISGK